VDRPAKRIGGARHKWLVLACVTFSLFMIMLDNTVVTVALPAIQSGLHASLSQLEWVVDAYALVFAVLLLPGGKLADFLGRRRIFLLGIIVFSLASLWCALATSGGMLITARGVQGLGAALMLPPTLAIIAETFAPEERGLAFGIWAAISGAALAIGPLVGGILVQGAHWSWIFYINVPIGVVGILSTLVLVPESRDSSAEQRLDIPGLLTSGAAMFALVFGLIESIRVSGAANGMTYIEMGWVLEDNFALLRLMRLLGGRQYKTYRCYEKPLP
jgi:MFS family permease